MCRHCGETVAHLLLHCEMAYRLWSFVFITFGLSWVVPRSIPDLLLACGISWGSTDLKYGI